MLESVTCGDIDHCSRPPLEDKEVRQSGSGLTTFQSQFNVRGGRGEEGGGGEGEGEGGGGRGGGGGREGGREEEEGGEGGGTGGARGRRRRKRKRRDREEWKRETFHAKSGVTT